MAGGCAMELNGETTEETASGVIRAPPMPVARRAMRAARFQR